MSDRLVTVGTFPDVAMAYLAKGRLEEAGIPCFLAEENVGGWLLGVAASWPKIQVPEADALRAIAVEECQEAGQADATKDNDPELSSAGRLAKLKRWLHIE